MFSTLYSLWYDTTPAPAPVPVPVPFPAPSSPHTRDPQRPISVVPTHIKKREIAINEAGEKIILEYEI